MSALCSVKGGRICGMNALCFGSHEDTEGPPDFRIGAYRPQGEMMLSRLLGWWGRCMGVRSFRSDCTQQSGRS